MSQSTVELHLGDCLEVMLGIPDGSIDMILADLPYEVTARNAWDVEIPMQPLWTQYRRIIKDDGAIVLTCSQPFTTRLINAASDIFRYTLVWDKVGKTGFLNSNRMPLRQHEDIAVFYKKLPTYNPQMETRGKVRKKGGRKDTDKGTYNKVGYKETFNNTYYPGSIISISNAGKNPDGHPNEKPVALMEYLILTYTNDGETVLDNCMGGGSTGVACVKRMRNFIGIEKIKGHPHFEYAKRRISEAQMQPSMDFVFA